MKTVLSIAGSDCSGGAGIQADLKTMTMNGVYAMTAITALTAQNTTGVQAVMEVTPTFLEQQIDSIFTDIAPDAVKIGMISSPELVDVIAKKLREYEAHNIVLDPVMVATSGSALSTSSTIEEMKNQLFALATVITPNIPEAQVLWGKNIDTANQMEEAAADIAKRYGCSVLVKGGHRVNDANDYLFDVDADKGTWFVGQRINNTNTHGTGCTLSSAIASNLAKGYDLDESIECAKNYLSDALAAMLDLGKGSGPMQHNFNLNGTYKEVKE
ncbi:bifunctional hydroxymethylpyrimidine kinase/phosphomethylpyrimidine kinase [Alloscardovia omnicolens]|uniref:bifunctional hydroxymethylpyrimidine kinase/phosphomethylpyrimidine kinase n=1 Tax=Alloscardovia omnicolens TaxID=419015 RepID=UPI0025500738|nr:bifunctional hydroxymethylpyrimidine kinase/phosphomethylpyrimidine kinase [Alloscardovia omnicolens]MDK6250978.1 bifunctional hydroxymethylpyrimidine kinase/phosphomethylpyrimidine kinase [Alloscardovia omnicolens]